MSKIRRALFRGASFYAMWLSCIVTFFYSCLTLKNCLTNPILGLISFVVVFSLIFFGAIGLLSTVLKRDVSECICPKNEIQSDNFFAFRKKALILFPTNYIHIHLSSRIELNCYLQHGGIKFLEKEFIEQCKYMLKSGNNNKIAVRFSTWLPVERQLIPLILNDKELLLKKRNCKMFGLLLVFICLVTQMFTFPHRGLAKQYLKHGLKALKNAHKAASSIYCIKLSEQYQCKDS